MIPPSPPVFAYEVYTLSVGMSTTVGFFLFCCLCCALCGKGFDRDRGTSRMVGTGKMRVDGSGWGDEGRGKRSHNSGLFGPDFHSKTRNHELAVGFVDKQGETSAQAQGKQLGAPSEEASFSWSWLSSRASDAFARQGNSDESMLRRGFVRVNV